MISGIPTIETRRLILRGPRITDFDAVADFLASERSEPVGGPAERHIAWARFTSQAGAWMLLGYGMWTVEEKSSGLTVGRVGIHNPDGWIAPELGWSMFDAGVGKGFAQEAAVAARRYAYENFGMETLISTIAADNARSIALAAKLGAKYEQDWQSPYGPLGIYRHPAPAELGAA